MSDWHIEHIGGNCPVQAEGSVYGHPFYFRARGSSWTFEVYDEEGVTVIFQEWEMWGDEPFGAGWMPEEDAQAIVVKCIEKFGATQETPSEEGRSSPPEG